MLYLPMYLNPADRIPVNSKHSILTHTCYGYYWVVWCSLTSHQWGYPVDHFQLFNCLFFMYSPFSVCCLSSLSPFLAACNTSCCSALSFLSLISQAVMRRMGFTCVGRCSTLNVLHLQQGPDCLSSLPPQCLVSSSAPTHPYSYMDLSGNAYRLLLVCLLWWMVYPFNGDCLSLVFGSMFVQYASICGLRWCVPASLLLLSPLSPTSIYIHIYLYIYSIYTVCAFPLTWC